MNPVESKAVQIAKIVGENVSTWDAEHESQLAASIVSLWRGLACEILKHAAHEIRPCKACAATLYFVRTNLGVVIPYSEAGISHFIDCPNADQFSRRVAEQIRKHFGLEE